MIEIVFGESACGSLKIAQTYGKGKYRGSAVSIFMRHEDGSVPSSDEMKKAQLQAQEQERIAWETRAVMFIVLIWFLVWEIFLIMELANSGKIFSRKCCLSAL
jgi:hypothetical protein